MPSPSLRLVFAATALLLLAACATTRLAPNAELIAQQKQREAALSRSPDWTLAGRLGVSDARDGGSGSLEWRQDGDRYRFSVHAPVTGKTWVLRGDAHRAVLEGLRDRPVEGGDAASLLERELGWHVPVAALTDWVRGARAEGPARIEFRGDGLPATIEQDGWTIDYPDYDASRDPPLPKRVFARKGDYRVRLSIREWDVR